MSERRNTIVNFKTPDLSKMKAVVIDYKTVIYIEHGASEEEARKRYTTKPPVFSKSFSKPKVDATNK